MGDLKDVLTGAVAAQDVPFVVAMVTSPNGTTFSDAAGDAANGRAASEDTVFRVYSMSKAIGALAAMILIDRGQLSMDTPVADILPEWDKTQVLDGFTDNETPIMRPPKVRATVRHLATHTNGMEYAAWNAETDRYFKATRNPMVSTGLKSGLMHPLTSDPGTRWGYGPGLDWLGQVVEAVDGRRIDTFCQEEIFEPLGMVDTVFEPDRIKARLCDISLRTKDGNFAPFTMNPPSRPEFYGMGHALYSTAPDYLRFLRMVLNGGQLDGNRVLSDAAMAQMLADQMQGLEFRPMKSGLAMISADVDLFPGIRATHSFAFVRNEADIPGKRSAGSMGWAGVCNTHYWIDPARDLAAVIMTQSLPFVEPRMMQTYDAFERAVYAGR